jgi:glutamyl-tRNA synthetase
VYVHLPVILSPKGGKLSKRDGATNVREFIEQGYLPEAMTNFLALLGWSFDGERSMFTLRELEQEFVLEKIGMASPVFDRAKLDDYNGKYIRMLSDEDLAARCLPYLINAGLVRGGDDAALALVRRIMPLYRERLAFIKDIAEQARFFFSDAIEYRGGEVLIPKKSTREEAAAILAGAERVLGAQAGFTPAELEPVLRALVEELGLTVRAVFMTLRLALTGSEVSPGLFETMEALGRERCLARIAAARHALACALSAQEAGKE